MVWGLKRLVFLGLAVMPVSAMAEGIVWQDWSDKAFSQAKAEHKLVLLDVRSAWCHWCHVMDNTTYKDKAIVAEIAKHYVAVSVDQNSHPDISHRYENYGWPATIIFAADGTEIVKRRGYVDPDTMKVVLAESFADPTPNPNQTGNGARATTEGLTSEQHDKILSSILWFYDKANAGWGDGHKFLEPNMMELALTKASAGNNVLQFQAENTLKASYGLIDPVAGGVYQYSDAADWKSPHYEKIMGAQSAYVMSYAYAFGVLRDAQYSQAMEKVVTYLDSTMMSPDGAFFTSQDADVSEGVLGKAYYAADVAVRKKLGAPKVDKNVYSSVNGQMISSLSVAYTMTGDKALLARALKVANWIKMHRSDANGGYRHGEKDKDGPFFADTLVMARAMMDLYGVTGDRAWLAEAQKGAKFMLANFADKKEGGFFTAVAHEGAVLKAYKQPDENLMAARFFNLLSYYETEAAYRKTALEAFQIVSGAEQIEKAPFSPGLLLADAEIKKAPLHITVVGGKEDAKAQELFAATIGMVPLYKQTEWYDKKEGKLPGSDIEYPDLPEAAVFVCSNNTCSLPMQTVKALKNKVEELRAEQ